MSKHTNMQRDVLVLNLEEQLEGIADEKFGKTIKECTDKENYYILLEMSSSLMDVAEV
jgi:starch phosphorylase